MKTKFISNNLISRAGCGILAFGLVVSNLYAAQTTLATEPFTLSSSIKALPNIMFVLDDSGSMRQDYLPDWAGPYQQTIASVLTTVTPAHRFFNSAYNGIAYNPATRYRPPVMYTSGGTLDTTTYPSQTGESVTAGGNASASTASPNWRAVKIDGYGVQSSLTTNLEGAAAFFTTVPGEYCSAVNLRSCVAASAPTVSNSYPAPLRWCHTSAQALDTTTGAGTNCQASNIDVATGITDYTYPRIPRPRTSSVTISVAGTVTSITVDGSQILSASATGGTTTDVAADIAAKINACTYGATGSCAVLGYRAEASANVVVIAAPGAITSTPVLAGTATTAVTAFSGGNVPGATLFTVITSTNNSYPYPGSATKAVTRTDCAGTTCTYAEEMTNYANWYAYYRTRMQMMKTAASIAFGNVDENFRVGYFSINNGGGNDFINVSAFNGTQRNAWYSKFFAAVPFGATPLRGGLANAGRFYAGMLTTLNAQTVTDPIQYSCQQNYTILSTDGYWNDASNPKQIDGSTDVGQQDGNDPRPYYDGATQTRTVTQTTRTDSQVGINTKIVTRDTYQLQTLTERILQSVDSITTYPKTLQTWQLQRQTTPLDKTEYRLESRTYPLKADTRELEERVFQIQSTTRPLEKYTYNLDEISYPLQEVVTNITKTTSPLQQREQLVQKDVYPLQQGELFIRKRVTPLQKMEEFVQRTTYPLQQSTYLITQQTYALQSSTFKLRKSERQLQIRKEVSTDGGDTWVDTGWVNASSCTVAATGPGYTRNTQCRYDTAVDTGGLASCTTVTASAGPTNYTVGVAVSCAYETAIVATVPSGNACTASSQSVSSPYSQYVTCDYAATSTDTPNQSTCTAFSQATASKTGDKVACVYAASATVTNVASCTETASNTGAASKITCGYSATANPVETGLTSCTPKDQTGTTAGTAWSGDKAVCAYQSASWAWDTACTTRTPSPAYSNTRVSCQYGTTLGATTLGTYSGYTYSSCSPNTTTANGDRVDCQYQSTVGTWSNVTNCPYRDPTDYSQTKIRCQYGSSTTSSTTSTGSPACVNYSQSTTAAMTGDKVVCSYTGTTWTAAASCTPRDPGTAYNNTKIDCQYGTAGTGVSGNTTCTPNATGVADNTLLSAAATGDKVVCVWDTSSATNSVASCLWNVPAAPTSTKRTCQYGAGTTTATDVTACTAVPASSGSTNGTNWTTSTYKACVYRAAIIATNQASCTPGGTANSGNNYYQYWTCGYGAGVVTNNLNSCTVDPAEAGPSYSGGSTTACAYQTTYTYTNVPSCSPVAQSGTFAAPEKRCVYAAVVTSTNLSTCSDQAVSGSAPYAGPARACYYDTTASATNLNASSCTANRQTTSPYSGPAIDCTYNATGVVTNGVSTCTTQAQSGASPYAGPAVSCAYGSPSAWSNVTSGSCTVVPQTGPTYAGPSVACRYNRLADTWADNTCANVAQSTASPYSVRLAKNCDDTDYVMPVVNTQTTVDTCSTNPTSTTNATTGVKVDTTTTCSYQAATTATATACTCQATSASPTAGGASCLSSGGVSGATSTTRISCQANHAETWVAVAPSCSASGAFPGTYDAVTGKIVRCNETDTTPYTAAYTSGPVPVASCTAGTNAATKEQTTCTPMLSTGPTPVQTCTTVNPGLAPDYVKTICNTTNTTASVMGCSSQVASSPLWQTITCVDDGSGTRNTLADVAAYYYKADLRTPTLGNCTGAIISPATTGNILCSTTNAMNNVPTTATDTNPAQHMTTFTLGLGASGYMRYSSTYDSDTSGDFYTVKGVSPYLPANGIAADPSNGVCSWQSTGNCNWPVPTADEQTTVDDLWHAGVNGRGAYFSATDPVSLSNSISSALKQVSAQSGVAAASSISNSILTPADSYVFSGSYKSVEWTGDVIRFALDPVYGIPGTTVDWSAQSKLDAKTAASRSIYTFDSSVATTKLKAFTAANFASSANFLEPNISTLTQYQCLYPDICLTATNKDTSHAAGANLVNYLRGDRTYEGTETDNSKYYRQRTHVLGDIANAQVVYVTTPSRSYADAGYAEFKSAQASRQAMVYAAANDGMVHAIAARGSTTTESLVKAAADAYVAAVLDPTDATKATTAATTSTAATSALASDTTIGQELWAYIPSMVLPNLYRLADKKYADKHRYFVDATPTVGDICVSNCTNAATAVWKTILVGGLGRGGRGYYALDVTDPTNPKALWEFNDANLGYTYGSPKIAKLSNGTWVVLLTTGYNNVPNDDGSGGDGVGRLYVLNANTGAAISGVSPLSTGVGDTTTPSGLTKITAAVNSPTTDATIVAVYGGDLLGNLWRFDVNDQVGATGFEAQLFAVLKDGSGNTQPITTQPIVSTVSSTSASNIYIVIVGTGQLLAESDASLTTQQTIYGIVDHRETGTVASNPIYDNPGGAPRLTSAGVNSNNFVMQKLTSTSCPAGALSYLCSSGETVMTSTAYAVDLKVNNGWFVDLINPAERANLDGALALGTLVMNTNAPSSVACELGGKSYQYWLDYKSGGYIPSAGNPAIAGNKVADALVTAPTLYLVEGGLRVGTQVGIGPSGFSSRKVPVSAEASITQRTSWRELIVE